jgi:hypothetical protein
MGALDEISPVKRRLIHTEECGKLDGEFGKMKRPVLYPSILP